MREKSRRRDAETLRRIAEEFGALRVFILKNETRMYLGRRFMRVLTA
jgi:hypothetical protein